jgi:hypothetical protein
MFCASIEHASVGDSHVIMPCPHIPGMCHNMPPSHIPVCDNSPSPHIPGMCQNTPPSVTVISMRSSCTMRLSLRSCTVTSAGTLPRLSTMRSAPANSCSRSQSALSFRCLHLLSFIVIYCWWHQCTGWTKAHSTTVPAHCVARPLRYHSIRS